MRIAKHIFCLIALSFFAFIGIAENVIPSAYATTLYFDRETIGGSLLLNGSSVTADDITLTFSNVIGGTGTAGFQLTEDGIYLSESYVVSFDITFNRNVTIDLYSIGYTRYNTSGTFMLTGPNGTSGSNVLTTAGTFPFDTGTIPVFVADQAYSFSYAIVGGEGIEGLSQLKAFTVSPVAPDPAPGGVTADLELWLKADAGVYSDKNGYQAGTTPAADGEAVESWADHSGTRTNAATHNIDNAPVFIDDPLDHFNFNPAIRFDGASALDLYDDYIFADNTKTGVTILAAVKPKGIGANNFLCDFGNFDLAGYGMAASPSYHTLYTSGNKTSAVVLGDGINREGTVLSGVIRFSDNQEIFIDGETVKQSGISLSQLTDSQISENPTVSDSGGPFMLGRLSKIDSLNNRYFDGDMGELLVYAQALSAEELTKVESYLAAKYGITKAGNSVASDGTVYWDATANAVYHHDVTAIGQDDASALDQAKSLSVNSGAVLTIGDDGTSLGNGNFLAVGDNAGTVEFGNIAGDYDHINRIWKVAETGTVGAVTFDIGTNIAEAAYLLVSASTDFSAATAHDLTDGSVTVDVSDGQYLTFAKDAVTFAYYVATTGSNDTGDGSERNPWATITYAVSQCNNGDTIHVAAGTYTEAGISIDNSISILGAGAEQTIVQAAETPGTATNLVFRVGYMASGTVEFHEMTIRHGFNEEELGGGIDVYEASVIIDSCLITGNQAARGGGIGVAVNTGARTVTIRNSTIADNTAISDYEYDGGGGLHVYNGAPTLTFHIENSTVSGNSTNQRGGGFQFLSANNGSITLDAALLNVTVAGNSAATGKGQGMSIESDLDGVTNITLTNTILDNSSTDNVVFKGSPFNGTITRNYTIVRDDTLSAYSGTGNLDSADPLLNDLEDACDTGLPVHTLQAGSPAIDAGDNASAPATDQCGSYRVSTADIGAWEYADVVCVSGAGSTEVNGTYTQVNFFYGKPDYYKGSHRLRYSNYNNAWNLLYEVGEEVTFLYQSLNDSVDSPVEAGNWEEVDGIAPVPTITQGACQQQYTLTVNKAGAGRGTVTSSPAGLSCDGACTTASADFDENQVVTLTAAEDTGTTFGGWTGDCVGSEQTCNVTMNAAQTVTATFIAPDITVKRGGREIAHNGGTSVTCSGSCTGSLVEFTIRNDGDAALTLGTVSMTGETGNFSGLTQPAKTTLNPNEETTFSITFSNPSDGRPRLIALSIASNDPDESPFTFKLVGNPAYLLWTR